MEQGPHILIVDDQVLYHKIYQMTLEDAFPCTISFAANGQDAILKFEENSFDLILLDLNLPDMSGEDVLAHIKGSGSKSQVPVIILTGETQQSLQSKLLHLGADDFIEKGASSEILIARMSVQLRHKMAIDRASELAMEMDAFTTGVLHDIRNIEHSLVGLIYLTKMLFEQDPIEHKDEILEHLDKLKEKAGSISSYGTEIIEKVKESHEALEMRKVVLQDVIHEVTDLLKSDALDRSFEVVLEEPLGTLWADPHFLKLSLFNIIQNSIKYRQPDLPPSIRISHTTRDSNHLIKIKDNGIGIPEAELSKVFSPFVRGTDKHARNQKGFGLGLSMVSRAISKMKGKVWAEKPSLGEEGTVMCIQLPLEYEQALSA